MEARECGEFAIFRWLRDSGRAFLSLNVGVLLILFFLFNLFRVLVDESGFILFFVIAFACVTRGLFGMVFDYSTSRDNMGFFEFFSFALSYFKSLPINKALSAILPCAAISMVCASLIGFKGVGGEDIVKHSSASILSLFFFSVMMCRPFGVAGFWEELRIDGNSYLDCLRHSFDGLMKNFGSMLGMTLFVCIAFLICLFFKHAIVFFAVFVPILFRCAYVDIFKGGYEFRDDKVEEENSSAEVSGAS